MKLILIALALTVVSVTANAQNLRGRPSPAGEPTLSPLGFPGFQLPSVEVPFLTKSIGPENQPLRICEVFTNKVVISVLNRGGQPVGTPKVRTLNVLNLSGELERAQKLSQSPRNYTVAKHIVAQDPAIFVKGNLVGNNGQVEQFLLFQSESDTRVLKGRDAKELLERADRACGRAFTPAAL